MAAVTGPGDMTAPMAAKNEKVNTDASESVDNFAALQTKRHFTGGVGGGQEKLRMAIPSAFQ